MVYTGEVILLLSSFCMLCSICSHQHTQYHYPEKQEIEEACPHTIQENLSLCDHRQKQGTR
jgi:hypothetical protein